MKKTEIDSMVSALCAYTKVTATCRRLLKRQLCTNACIDQAIHKFLHTDESRREYETLFSIVPPRDFSSVVSEADSLEELKSAVDYHIHGIELLKEVSDAQVDYMTRLFYKLASAIYPFYEDDAFLDEFKPVVSERAKGKGKGKGGKKTTFAVRSPPPPKKKRVR
jgi:hypothetical protein